MTKPTTYNYRVDLRPLDVYFFGGEITFGNGEEVNYFAKSRPYPQQTTILGVLRHLGYKTPGIGPTDIGESFAAEANVNQGKYGFIQAISPLFFTRKFQGTTTKHLLGPMLNGAQSGAAPLAAAGAVSRWNENQQWQDVYELPRFSPKEWYEQPLIPTDEDVEKLDDLVTTDVRIGITKQRDGAERTNGFYKQEVATLASGVSFSAYLRLADRASNIAPAQVLPIGGEKALFSVTLTDLKKEPLVFDEAFPAKHFNHCASAHLYCAVLLSDAFVEAEAFEQLPFVIADTKNFRYLSTPSGDKRISDFGRLSRTVEDRNRYPDQMHQSSKYNLLARGSLLYADDRGVLEKMLDIDRWKTIGYNHFHLLPKTA